MFYKIFKFKLQLTTKLSEISTLKFIYKQWYVLSLKKKKIFYLQKCNLSNYFHRTIQIFVSSLTKSR